MAIKIIKEPTQVFVVECEQCECIFSYEEEDLGSEYVIPFVKCPHCGKLVSHLSRKKYTEGESNGSKQ